MQTTKPTFDTLCISPSYPTIKGSCLAGVIDVYDEEYNLLKSENVSTSKFFINLDDVEFKAILIKNTAISQTVSEFSNVLVKCCEAQPCIEKVRCNKCKEKPKCPCQQS